MPRRPKQLSVDEIAEINAQYHAFEQEALLEPMEYFPHDNNAHLDDAMRLVVTSCDSPSEGLAMGYKYWCLMELLTARKGHLYDVSTDQGWRFLSIDMSTCGVVVDVDQCKELVSLLLAAGLLSRAAYDEAHHVLSERVCHNAAQYAKRTADKKIGAWKTNRAKAKTG